MNIKLIEQRRKMQKAIDILNHIEQLDRMSEHLDPAYVAEQTLKYVDEYADILKELIAGCLKDSGMILKEIPENKLAAIA